MSRPVGRHRAPRRNPLYRPAVAATATLSALALSAAGYAGATGAASADRARAGLSADPVPTPTSGQATTTAAGSGHGAAPVGSAHSDVAGTRAAIHKAAKARAQVDGRRRAAAATQSAQALTHRRSADQASRSAALRALPMPANADSYVHPSESAQPDPAERSDQGDSPDVAAQSDQRSAPRTAEGASTSAPERASQPTVSRDAERPEVSTGDPRSIARGLVAENGWGSEQFGCLDKLWAKESGWRVGATNPASGAYGIPQSLPGSKMASAGGAWRTDAGTQIRWGLGYIKSRYGSPCAAWGHSQSVNWY